MNKGDSRITAPAAVRPEIDWEVSNAEGDRFQEKTGREKSILQVPLDDSPRSVAIRANAYGMLAYRKDLEGLDQYGQYVSQAIKECYVNHKLISSGVDLTDLPKLGGPLATRYVANFSLLHDSSKSSFPLKKILDKICELVIKGHLKRAAKLLKNLMQDPPPLAQRPGPDRKKTDSPKEGSQKSPPSDGPSDDQQQEDEKEEEDQGSPKQEEKKEEKRKDPVQKRKESWEELWDLVDQEIQGSSDEPAWKKIRANPLPINHTNLNWGEMQVIEPQLTEEMHVDKQLRSPVRKPDFFGPVINPPRLIPVVGDGMGFGLKRRSKGNGAILIDASGSMQGCYQLVKQLLDMLPRATIAAYGPRTTPIPYPLLVIAKNGRMLAEEDPNWGLIGHMNLIDYPALGWLARHRGEKWWITDGGVTKSYQGGEMSTPEAWQQCKDLAMQYGIKICRMHLSNANEIVEAIRKGVSSI